MKITFCSNAFKLLLFLFFCCQFSLFGNWIEERIDQIPISERNCMREFFHYVLWQDQAAYTLCYDTKAVCFTGVTIKIKGLTFSDKLCLRGWQSFKKYERLFPHPNFILNNSLHSDEDFTILRIYLINKNSLVTCLNRYLDLFKQRLGDSFSVNNFISRLETESLNSLINDDQMLLGVLLGFGEEASRAYQEAQDSTIDDRAPQWTSTYLPVEGKKPEGCKFGPIVFMGNPNSIESKQLIEIYDRELEEIWKSYKQVNDPLIFFLNFLCGSTSYFQNP